MLALVLDQFVIALEHGQAFLTLIIESGRSLEAAVFVGIGRRLIFVDFTRFLTRVLKPNDDHARRQIQETR